MRGATVMGSVESFLVHRGGGGARSLCLIVSGELIIGRNHCIKSVPPLSRCALLIILLCWR